MKRLRLKAVIAVLLFVSSPLAMAAETMDLLKVYEAAKRQDPVIEAARRAAAAGSEAAVQGRALLLPSVNATADYSYSYLESRYSPSNPFIPNISETFDSYSYGINVSQALFDKTRYASYQQGLVNAAQADTSLQLAEQELILRVAEGYFSVLSAQASVEVAESQKKAFAESLERANLTFKIGTATITDKLEAQARYDLARADEIAAANTLEVARQSLRSIIGEQPGELLPLREDAALPPLQPRDMDTWVQRALDHNVELRLAEQGVELSRQEIAKARGSRYPTVNLVANAARQVQYSPFADADNEINRVSVAVQLNMPLYTGGLNSSRVRQAVSARDEAAQKQEQTRRQISLQAQQRYLEALNGLQRVEALTQALASSESALEATRKGLEVGVRTNLDLLNAQQQFYSTKRDLAVAKYNYLLSLLQLKAASGMLAEQDLLQMSHLLGR